MTAETFHSGRAEDKTAKGDNMSDVYAFVGERLKELRISKALTQADVAAMLGVSPQQYQKYEDAQTKCRLDYLLKLAKYYAVPVDTILPGLDDKRTEDESVKELSSEADLLARLVSAFVRLNAFDEKLRFVQLVEAIIAAQNEE